jgi:hypothetical protein
MTLGDPRGWGESEWLDVLELLLARLRVATRAEIELGEYWMYLGPESASAALGARIRADGPLLWTDSDCWEAAFCVTGGSEGAYADVMAFPFRSGSVVTRGGRSADLPGEHDVDEFWLHHAGEQWEDRGFRYPDGPGEWDHVRAPGSAFFRSLRCTARPTFRASEPLVVTVDHRDQDEPSLGDDASFSIHRLFRDGQEIMAAPPALPLSRPGSSRRLPSGAASLPAAFDLQGLAIPGGWVPGRYRLEVRLDEAQTPTSRDSHISEPVELEVA